MLPVRKANVLHHLRQSTSFSSSIITERDIYKRASSKSVKTEISNSSVFFQENIFSELFTKITISLKTFHRLIFRFREFGCGAKCLDHVRQPALRRHVGAVKLLITRCQDIELSTFVKLQLHNLCADKVARACEHVSRL